MTETYLLLPFGVLHCVLVLLSETRLLPASFRNFRADFRSRFEKLTQKLSSISILPKNEL